MLSATLGKIAQNIYNLQQTDVDEVTEFTEGKVGQLGHASQAEPRGVRLHRLPGASCSELERDGPALDYIHAEWEDDHRQGETAWKFLPEICLLADAQLELVTRILDGLIVKRDHMERNLERAGGFVCSEALLMKLAAAIGSDRAHAIVKALSDDARRNETSFSDAVRAHPVVREHLSREEIEDCVNYRAYLGQTATLVDRVLASYRRSRGRRTRSK